MYAKASENRTVTATSARQMQVAEKSHSTLLPKSDEGALSRLIQHSLIQPKLAIGKPHDRFEREADQTAERVVQNRPLIQPQPEEEQEEEELQAKGLIQRQAEEEPEEEEVQTLRPAAEEEREQEQGVQRQEEEEEPVQALQRQEEQEEEEIQTKGLIQRQAVADVEQGLQVSRSGGIPMKEGTRAEMEGHFKADFSSVRLHTDAHAASMSRTLSAQAFTYGNHIYFGAGKYDPGSSAGKKLLAHELTHVVQQGAATRSKTLSRAPRSVQRLLGSIRERLAGYARHIPGYTLLTVIVGYDPLAGRSVGRTAENLLGGLMGLVPFGTALYDKLVELGLVGRAFAFVRAELERFDLSVDRLERTLQNARDEMDFFRLDPFAYNLGVLRRHFGALVADVRGFASSIARRVLQMIKEALLGALRRVAESIPGYRLFTMILGRDPLTGQGVERNTARIIEEFLLLIGQREHLEKMRETGTLQRVATWIDTQLVLLNFSFAEIRALFIEAWDAFSFQDVLDPVGAFRRTVNIFRPFVSRLFTFAHNVASAVLRFIKDALIGALANFARRVPGYTLLTVILGRDPFTGEAVARNATNLIRGFMDFVPGGEEKFRNLQESGAIDRAFMWLEEEITKLDLSMETIVGLFRTAWESLSIYDLINPVGAFRRMVQIFGPPIRRIIRFAAAVGMKILEFIFEGIMGAGGARVLSILRRTRDTFLTIIRDPVGFVGNLIRAVVQGFRQFAANILRHLQAGLVGWLFGALEGAGLRLPERFDLQGILSLVFQILGLTYERIRPRLVRLMGERAVSALERTFEFLRVLVTEGPAAAWRQIVEFVGNLRDMVMDAIKDWVITRIVQAAVTRLATLFNPAGAVIQAILAIYNTIMFFIERINQIFALVESVVDSIATIAAGAIGAAANFVEQTMGRTLPVIISFLARLIGLGDIANAIRRIIERIRRPIDRALDRVASWIARQARRLVARGRAAVSAGVGAVRRLLFPEHRFEAGGASHTLSVAASGGRPRLMISSAPQPVEEFLSRYEASRELSESQRTKIGEARALIRSEIDPLAQQLQEAEGSPERTQAIRRQLLQKEVRLSDLIRLIVGRGALNVEQLEYNLEGLTGTYASMPKPRRDDMTADHQPQAAILVYSARLPYFRDVSAMQGRAGSRANNGYAINVQDIRHRAGRTYGSKGEASKNRFIDLVDTRTRTLTTEREKRSVVVELIKDDMRSDVQEMRNVVNSDTNFRDIESLAAEPQEKQALKDRVKNQVLRGEDRIASQDLDSLKGT